MNLIYFSAVNNRTVFFKEENIKEESFYEDILRIGALKDGINPNDLFGKLTISEIAFLLLSLETEPEKISLNFFKKSFDNSLMYLEWQNDFFENVSILGENNKRTLLYIEGSNLIASNEYIKKNLLKVKEG